MVSTFYVCPFDSNGVSYTHADNKFMRTAVARKNDHM